MIIIYRVYYNASLEKVQHINKLKIYTTAKKEKKIHNGQWEVARIAMEVMINTGIFREKKRSQRKNPMYMKKKLAKCSSQAIKKKKSKKNGKKHPTEHVAGYSINVR